MVIAMEIIGARFGRYMVIKEAERSANISTPPDYQKRKGRQLPAAPSHHVSGVGACTRNRFASALRCKPENICSV
jgi:hypothetical protein